jgi:hypothetical protein
MQIQVTMQMAKLTTNTVQYRELDDQLRPIWNQRDCKVGTVYVPKASLPQPPPDKIRVTVETL